MQIRNFSKIQSKIFENFFENIVTFSCRGCQTLASDMRVIILLFIMKEEQAFYASVNFLKIRSKIFEKYFFENIASFSYRGCQTLSPDMRIIFLLSIMKEEQVFFVSVTNGQTDGPKLF